MHSYEWDIGRVLRGFVFALVCLILVIPLYPIQGQDSTPGTVIRDTTDAIQTLSPLVVALIIAVIILALIVVFFVVIASRTVSPAFNTIQSLMGQLNSERQERENERQERQMVTQKLSTALTDQSQAQSVAADQRAQTADTLERTANILSGLETKQEASDGRLQQTDDLKTHFDQSVAPIKEAADNTLTAIREVQEGMKTFATKAELDGRMESLEGSIEHLRQVIETHLLPIVPPALTTEPPIPPEDDMPSSTTLTPGVPGS